MPNAIISTTNVNDPDLTRKLHDSLVTLHKHEIDDIEITSVATAETELGVLQVVAVSIGAANLLLNVVKWVYEWRKSQRHEEDRQVDLKIEFEDCVIELKSKG